MTRAELAAYLGERYGAYLDAVSRLPEDTSGNLKSAIDDALRALGYADADVAGAAPTEASAIADLRVMGEYTLLAQITRDLAVSFNLSSPRGSLSLVQIRQAAEKDLARAEEAVLARFGTLVVLPEGSSYFTTLDLNQYDGPLTLSGELA